MADDDEPFSSADVSAEYVDLLVRRRDNSQAWADAVLFDGGDPDDPTAAELDQLPAASLTAALTFHLPGQHDQKTHGNRGGGPSLSSMTKMLKAGDSAALGDMFDTLLGGKFGGLSMAATYVDGSDDPAERFIECRFSVFADGGRYVGDGSVTIAQNEETGRWFLLDPGLQLNRDVQGGSFATEFYSKWTKWAIANKLTHVEILADIDVGGYAWAAQGWDWSGWYSSESTITDWAKRVRAGEGGGGDGMAGVMNGPKITFPQPTPEEDAAISEILGRMKHANWGTSLYPTPLELSQFGRKPGQGGKSSIWPGKAAMMGMNWPAVIRFE